MEANDLSRRHRLVFIVWHRNSSFPSSAGLKSKAFQRKSRACHFGIKLQFDATLILIEHVISTLKLHGNCRCFFGNTFISLDHIILVLKSYQNYSYSYDVALVLIP
jgi:hypothetical protein